MTTAEMQKPKRTIMGKIIKWTFILFNIFMLLWMWGGMSGSADVIASATNDAEAVGATIGTGLGAIMIGGIWLFGDIILGMFVLFTRPKQVIVIQNQTN